MRLEARVDAAEALSYLGYAGQDLGSDLAVRFDRAVELVGAVSAWGMSRTFRVKGARHDKDGVACAVLLEATTFALEGYDIARHLAGADEVALMVVTLGLESEVVLRRESAVSPTDGLLVDACASSLVESAANELGRLVAQRAQQRGLRVGSRFSPGYGDFPLSCQRGFLEAVGAAKALGISVTPGDLLVPSKSITAVAGLYAHPEPAVGEVQGGEGSGARGGARGCDGADTVGGAARAGSVGSAGSARGRCGAGGASSAVDAAGAGSAGDLVGVGDFGGTGAPIVPGPAHRTCETCSLAASCLLRAQGRTCYGR